MDDKFYHECYLRVCQTRRLLEDLRDCGYTTLPRPVGAPPGPARGAAAVAEPPQTDLVSLTALEEKLQNCTLCPLCESRRTVVFGRGNPHADLVFVGEAPGREEDLQGRPFVGEAGQLLDKIIGAMALSADAVYICNLIKCRPPANRDPEAAEVAACEPFLAAQLALIRPRIIVALGRFAAQTLLQNRTPISRLRGQWHTYENIPLMPTFHPAYLLRAPAEKKKLWEDMKQVMRRLHHPDTAPAAQSD
ncbi:MAG: uracil-DNA glycosylase [Pelovirga sp.]